MQEKIAIVRWVGNGAAVNIDLGFLPDRVEMVQASNLVNPDKLEWDREMADTDGLTGILTTGSTGVRTRVTTAATGISLFDNRVDQVLVPAPNGTGEVPTNVANWNAATNYAGGARTAVAVGTVVRPPVRNGKVFELTTAVGVGTAEPASWVVRPGQTVTDGGGNVWTCREERVTSRGAQGITVGATRNTNNNTHRIVAIAARTVRDGGLAAAVGAGGTL